MSLFRWKPEYAVGIKVIDDQHQILVGLINRLHDAIEDHFQDTSLESILEELFDYTRYHFTTEETLMAQYGYEKDKLAKHKKQHQLFIAELNSSQTDSDKLTREDAALIQEFLVNWLKNHILKVDTKLAEFLLNHETVHDHEPHAFSIEVDSESSTDAIKDTALNTAHALSVQVQQLTTSKPLNEQTLKKLNQLAEKLTDLLEQL